MWGKHPNRNEQTLWIRPDLVVPLGTMALEDLQITHEHLLNYLQAVLHDIAMIDGEMHKRELTI